MICEGKNETEIQRWALLSSSSSLQWFSSRGGSWFCSSCASCSYVCVNEDEALREDQTKRVKTIWIYISVLSSWRLIQVPKGNRKSAMKREVKFTVKWWRIFLPVIICIMIQYHHHPHRHIQSLAHHQPTGSWDDAFHTQILCKSFQVTLNEDEAIRKDF